MLYLEYEEFFVEKGSLEESLDVNLSKSLLLI